MLDHNQALVEFAAHAHNQLMTTDSERLAKILSEDLRRGSGVDRKKLADECGITKQAISNWIKTGTIKKRFLTVVAKHTGKPLSRYLLDGSQPYPLNPPAVQLLAMNVEPTFDDTRKGRARRRILAALEDIEIDELELLADDVERDATRQRRLRHRRAADSDDQSA